LIQDPLEFTTMVVTQDIEVISPACTFEDTLKITGRAVCTAYVAPAMAIASTVPVNDVELLD
jgi:hypothetical protein